ncbi:membrane fusion protein, multidrug efflux system [Enhydrobacter aerosaccus]|uniref:Membrane fusion protein, multidrug efflux system n=1 Tax=Enhydrobacter aerosaccus TaxID=225324 RepID=A0A1T4MR10_9HYPH|nr:efflux RND transporter periplasmic adaptor subunit [Enhydrobacter aerosaccus]SJZ69550.1 membrane fusion protein, multidrug efflux system [Enhydrobacter aerosaccus]
MRSIARLKVRSPGLRIFAAVVLVVVAGAAWFLMRGGEKVAPPAAAQTTAPAVGVRPAGLKGVSQAFEFVGRVKAVEKVEVRARVEGFLEKVLFREGQDVKAGDLLYQIEKVQFQAQVQQAEANLAAAEAEQTNAQLQYSRQLDLSKRQYSPQSTVDQNKAALDTSKAKIMQAEAALTQAKVNLDYTDIRAPIDGRIGRTAYTVGNLVNPSTGILATIVSQDPVYVLFPVSVRDLETIRAARQRDGGLSKIDIRLRLSSGEDYTERGTWNFTDPQVDQLTDTLIMRATMPNPHRVLSDGQFVTAIIRERRESPRLVIPQAALQVDQSGYYALIVDGQHRVEQRRLKTGPNLDTDVVVTSGLNEGDKVIVDGIQKVRPGQTVQETMLPAPVGG